MALGFRLSRRAFLRNLCGLTAAGVVTGIYGRTVESEWLDVVERTVPLPVTVSGPAVRVLHLSDFHFSRSVPLALIDAAITAGLALKPDIACLTGDFVTTGAWFDQTAYARTLARLSAVVPTFATLGNHDGGPFTAAYGGAALHTRVVATLRSAGIMWLDNATATVTVRGRRLQIVGCGDLWNTQCRPEIAWRGFVPEPGAAIVALSHNPDSKRFLLPYPWHVLLCGHTHGGQIWPELIGRHIAPVEDTRYIAGLYDYEGRWLHITRGVGSLHGVRILCRPEVSLLRIV